MTKTLPLRLPEEMYNQLSEYAQKNGISMNSILIIALKEYLKREDG